MKLSVSRVEEAVERLMRYVERDRFAGYDPYDILNSRFPFRWFGTYASAVATQLHKRNPVNVRPLLSIRKEHNPKGLGLLLSAYSLRQQLYPEKDGGAEMRFLLERLKELKSDGFQGACWGYNFPWASPGKFLPRYAPSSVVTAFVVKGLYDFHRLTGDEAARRLIIESADFISQHLAVTEDATGICFSYTPYKKDICYNASLLAAETLSRVYALTGKPDLKEKALAAARFVVARQKEDGRWNYSQEENRGTERTQIDFHQGYVLDSLRVIQTLTQESSTWLEESIARGLTFYEQKQFLSEGRSLWRWPKTYPVDIHNQAQGVITFSRNSNAFADQVLAWTMENMYDEAEGYFYYRKYPMWTHRIPYIRWSNAWMLVAMTEWLKFRKNKP